MAPVREVAFQLECFEWAEDRLDVAGRWQGLAGRRLGRPVLTVVTTAGRRKRLVALPGGRFAPTETSWRAEFAWAADPGEITGAVLEVGGNVVVDLPLPDKRRRRRRKAAAEAAEADEALQAELGALRGQVDRLRTELAGREREIMRLRVELDETSDDEPGLAEPEAMTVDIELLAAERDDAVERMTVAIERVERERSEAEAAAAAALAHAQEQIDDLREAFAEAAAEADAVRERHREELARVTEALEAERAQIVLLRDALEQAGGEDAVSPASESPEDAKVPPPLTETARRRAAGPPTQPLAPDATDGPLAAIPPAALDPPGPLRAGGRPATPGGTGQDEAARSRIPAWPRAGTAPDDGDEQEATRSRIPAWLHPGPRAEAEPETPADRNGHVPEATPVPPPLRTAAAARARAGASVAARRSAVELWALRIGAAIALAVLLIAVLLLSHIA